MSPPLARFFAMRFWFGDQTNLQDSTVKNTSAIRR
jgi:hypothetical protein